MNVKLSAELEALAKALVDSGRYDSTAQVVEEALLLLEEREQGRRLRRDRLVKELAAGLLQADNHQLVAGREVFEGLVKQPKVANE